MKFDKETFAILEAFIELMAQRTIIAHAVGTDNPVTKELDIQLDAIKAKLTGEI